MKAFVIAATLVCIGCASTPKRPESMSPSKPPPGVMLWSEGAYEAEVEGRDRTVIHIGFLSNEVDHPCARELAITAVETDDRTIQNPKRVAVHTSSREIQAIFVLPRGLDPQDVDAFDVTCGGQTTRFLADEVNAYEPTNYAQRRFDLLFY